MSDVGTPSVVLRRERAQRSVARLADAVAAWRKTWLGASEQTSQIHLVGATLERLLVRLAAQATAIADFGGARGVDGDVAVVERLWRYLADRFDQRRDPALAPTLRAADDVIWACTAEVRTLAGPGAPVMPLPLAYLEPAYSPTAIPRATPPLDLEASDRALARILAYLPVPLIGLPTSVVAEPWWLVLLAHEVGHHVQYDLEPDGALIERAGDVLAAAAGPAGDEAERWRGWSREVFADAFAVATAGAAAIAATVELEWDAPAAMADERGAYPPALIRLALMIEVGRALGVASVEGVAPTLAALDEVAGGITDDAVRAATRERLRRASIAAAALVAMPIGVDTLATLAARFGGGDERPLDRALGGAMLGLDRGRIRPLRAASGAFRAYRALAAVGDATSRARALGGLGGRTLPVIAQVREHHDVLRGDGGAAAGPAVDALVDGIEGLLRATERGRR